MLTYFLKCKRDKENVSSNVIKNKKMVEQCYYQNVLYEAVKKSRFIKK